MRYVKAVTLIFVPVETACAANDHVRFTYYVDVVKWFYEMSKIKGKKQLKKMNLVKTRSEPKRSHSIECERMV